MATSSITFLDFIFSSIVNGLGVMTLALRASGSFQLSLHMAHPLCAPRLPAPSPRERSCSSYPTRAPKMHREFGRKGRKLHAPILRPLGVVKQKSLEDLKGRQYTN